MERLGDILDRQKISRSISQESTGTPSDDNSTEEVDSSPHCQVCGDVGWVTLEVPFGHHDFGKALPCKCVRAEWEARVPNRLEEYSNLGPLVRLTFDRLEKQGRSPDEDNRRLFQTAYEAAKRYADEPRGWLVLTGNSGSGKTYLAAAIANHCIGLRISTYFMVVPDLLDHLRATFGPKSEVTYDELFEQVRNVPLLILDDLGAQTSSSWATEKLFQVLNHRFNSRLPTVITTNVPLDRLDESLQSRLTNPDMSKVVEVGRRFSVLSAMDGLSLSIPARMTFETFRPSGRNLKGDAQDNLEAAFQMAKTFAESLDGWLVLNGFSGCGKTHLAAAIANYHRDRGKESLFILVSDLLDHLRFTYDPSSTITYDQLFNKVRTVSLLVLDDYGEHATTDWAEEKLYQIINYRYNGRLPTVITTSLPLTDIDERISSRFTDPAVAAHLTIKAPDYRTGKYSSGERRSKQRARKRF